MSALVDRFGRVARDVRISLTDRCNLRCTYCMPAEGLPVLPAARTLTSPELQRLTRILGDLGIRKIRLTGGEPLLRLDLETIVRGLAGFEDVAMTTNAIGLAARASGLVAAGLRRINISLDSLDPERYRAITRRGSLSDALAGLEAAIGAGLAPVKLNVVLRRGINDDEIEAFTDLANDRGIEVRFLEWMPLDADGAWRRQDVVPSAEVLDRVAARVPLLPRLRDSAPARSFAFADGRPGGVGVIGSVTEPFCSSCDRLRLTVDGALKTCLFAHEETDLRGPMRAGASDAAIVALIRDAVAGKPAGHGIDEPAFMPPLRSMSAIGG